MSNTDTLLFKFQNILFVIFSIMFLHTCYSLDADVSAFDVDRLFSIVTTLKITSAIAVLLLFKIIYMGQFTVVVLSVFILNIFYKIFSLFLVDYDKILLLLSVIYLLISYNIILLIREELSQAIFSPRFDETNFNFDQYSNIKIKLSNRNGIEEYAKVSNFDEKGIVIFSSSKYRKGEIVDVLVDYEGHQFNDRFIVELKYDVGFGLKVLRNKTKESYNWYTLFNILKRRGISSI